MIGASGFTAESPVIIPTSAAPKMATISKNFSLTSALIGAVYQPRRPTDLAANSAATPIRLLPEPVGVAATTLSPVTRCSSASS